MRCLAIENYSYRSCPQPWREFRSAVSLHNHSSHSMENLASLNEVSMLPFMRPFKGILQRSFGLAGIADLDYADLRYNPPAQPEQVFELELAGARQIGFDTVSVAITDHDEISGSLELAAMDGNHTALGEEFSFRFEGYPFHLGLTGMSEEMHAPLQAAARAGRLDELFERLRASGCLVVLNHPLLPWKRRDRDGIPARALLSRFAWAIDALEYNGMRPLEENDSVLELARAAGKPVVGGGDSHMLTPSSVVCGTNADTYRDYIEEVKAGRSTPLVKPDYFAPLRWKLFLRVLNFIAHYRQIANYRGEPAHRMLQHRRVLLDPVGCAARLFLRASAACGWIR